MHQASPTVKVKLISRIRSEEAFRFAKESGQFIREPAGRALSTLFFCPSLSTREVPLEPNLQLGLVLVGALGLQ